MSPENLKDKLQKLQPNICLISDFASREKDRIDYFIKRNIIGIFLVSPTLGKNTFNEIYNHLTTNYGNYEFCEIKTLNAKKIGYLKLNQGEKENAQAKGM